MIGKRGVKTTIHTSWRHLKPRSARPGAARALLVLGFARELAPRTTQTTRGQSRRREGRQEVCHDASRVVQLEKSCRRMIGEKINDAQTKVCAKASSDHSDQRPTRAMRGCRGARDAASRSCEAKRSVRSAAVVPIDSALLQLLLVIGRHTLPSPAQQTRQRAKACRTQTVAER